MDLPVESVRRVGGFALVVPELTFDPALPPAWRERNDLQRALAHLLGYDGSQSVVLRSTAAGVLQVEIQNASLAVTGAVNIADPTAPAVKAAVDSAQNLRVSLASAAVNGPLTALANSKPQGGGSYSVSSSGYQQLIAAANAYPYAALVSSEGPFLVGTDGSTTVGTGLAITAAGGQFLICQAANVGLGAVNLDSMATKYIAFAWWLLV
jgi:hypothetical protein